MDSTDRGGFNFQILRLPLFALGIFGILAGLATFLVMGDGLPARILGAAGILFVGVYIALDPGDIWGWMRGRSGVYTGNVAVITIAAVVILGLLNVLASRYPAKWDLTAGKSFTLSDQSKQIAASLPGPVHATAFFQSSDSSKTDLQSLFQDYQTQSGGKFTYEFIDPDINQVAAITAKITAYQTIVYQMGDKQQNSTGATEKEIATALIKLTRPIKKIYFTVGHGERTIDGFGQQDYGNAKDALDRDNFQTATLDLLSQRSVPADAAEVVIAGPTADFSAEEKDALRAYLDGGGSLMLLVDPQVQSKASFNDILSKWDVAVTGNLVLDPGKNLQGDPSLPLIDSYQYHATTQNLRSATVYLGTTNITYPQQGPAGSSVYPIAQTTDQSWGESNLQQPAKDPSDPTGPLAVIVAIEQNVSSGTPAPGASTPTSRIFIIGTSSFLANQVAQRVPGNDDLFMNAANWLAEQDDVINIRPPDDTLRTVTLTNTQTNLVLFSSILFLPLAVLAAGLAVWWTHR